MRFEELNLIDPLLRAVQDQGYTEPTPIQEQAIPHILAGRDLVGLAQTGTGKTAAFALPILQRLMERTGKKRFIRVLVLAPTRELASQIHESFANYGKYTKLSQMTIFGGVSQRPQVNQLRRGVHIVAATPGRLLDLMNQGEVRLDRLDVLVLDEADRMFDMGFLPDLRRIIRQLPEQRQNLLFSATMPPDIQGLASEILHDPVEVAVAPESTTVEAVQQQVYFVEKSDKSNLLKHLFNEHNMFRTLVFTRTKHGADRLSRQLNKARISAAPIHGNKSQSAREKTLAQFKRGKIQVLVATDIVARGIDVDEITHVVNYDLPNETESYVHRIGRTGRAGSSGMAISFCATDERKYLNGIERLIQMHIPVSDDHPYLSAQGVPTPTDLTGKRRSGNQSSGKNGNRKRNNRRRRNNRSRSSGKSPQAS
jgi:ATP-dependent RNA helicase RhlE